MSDQFKGEVYVTTTMEKERFEQSAYRCGWSVAINPIMDEDGNIAQYRLMFYTREEKENK